MNKKKKSISLVISSLIVLSCGSYEPFANQKTKKGGIENIRKQLTINHKELSLLKKNDSVLFSLNEALEKDVPKELIERRLDSFFLNSYTKSELLTILEIDKVFKGDWNMEFNRSGDKTNSYYVDGDAKRLKKVMDSLLNHVMSNMKYDTIISKKID